MNQAQNVSIESWEYDEVTDVSENSSSQHQAVLIEPNNISTSNTASPPEDNSQKDSLQVPLINTVKFATVASPGIDEVGMATMDETDFDPELEEKGGEATPSTFQEGHMEPSTTSAVDLDNSSTRIGREAGEGERVDPLEAVVDGYLPGPSHAPPPPHLAPTSPHHQGGPNFQMGGSQGDDTDEDSIAETAGLGEIGNMSNGPGQPLPLAHPAGTSLGADDDENDDTEDEDVHAPAPEGAYDPADYEHLNVSPEIQELFSYITRYTPQAIELEHRLRPYIPDYIPAVGDIDAFIKIPPPDGRVSLVGLEVLDEPSARQSDPTVLDLQLRALAKHTTAKSVSVKTVENAEKNGKVIEKWVRDISDLHRAKPPPTVHYTKRMPDIDTLMQEWPGEVEELLKEINLPTAALQLDLQSYVDIICATLDIPVYKSRIQSLHVLFTLYSVFKNSAHFRQLAEENYIDNDDSTADRLIIQ